MRRPVTGEATSPVPINHNTSSSRRNSMTIQQQFADIIRRFKDYTQHIRRLLKDTDKSYNDIRNTRVLTSGKTIEFEEIEEDSLFR